MASDTLSIVLRAIRLTGATFFNVMAAGAWATELRPREEIMPRLVPGADHLIACHLITHGRCFVNIASRTSIAMETGEVVVLLIEVVRLHLATAPSGQAECLAGLSDRFVGRALSQFHRRPAYNWTIERLAKEVGLSRSTLAERFTDLVGVPPMLYLAKWRMQIALGLLRDCTTKVAYIASEVGYESEEAFSRAFKRIMGMPLTAWRRRCG